MRALALNFLRRRPCWLGALLMVGASCLACPGFQAEAASLRRTALVAAVERASPAVVNIHGRKTIQDEDNGNAWKQVNGMGTGIIIDERGYIITNFHVVDGVKPVQVSMASGKTTTAELVAHDPTTDLAIIKIESDSSLPTISIGTSSDLMNGEEVIAIGNAYGYEHTVTRGIISALHRTVEIGEGQQYADLIQTDASINPGNSGGPLLNIDGDMIGINVAVRVGAQGIGFAVPIDRALDVAAQLLDVEVNKVASHGISGRTLADPDSSEFLITGVADNSPAQQAGVLPGDVITAVDDVTIVRALDYERALLGHTGGDTLSITVRRGEEAKQFELVLDGSTRGDRSVSELAWDVLGMRLAPVPDTVFRRLQTRYGGGLKVIGVRPESPAAQQGIRYGDVLVGMHKWETASLDNISYILDSEVVRSREPIKFYVLRGGETLFGYLQVSMRTR